MSMYRKKPVIIEAREVPRYRDGDITPYLEASIALAGWCGGVSHMMVNTDEKAFRGAMVIGPHIVIHTLEGDHAALPGDFIIQGVQGEFYPCKPDIFAATYEAVSFSLGVAA